jgi:5-methylcytosine-specific restriction endonuclease McrA
MQRIQNLAALSDDDLLHGLAALVADSRRTEADLVGHIAEVDARRLYAREATPSMFQYCTERLHLSGAEAYLRIAAGRAAREHPVVLAMLADGRLHLTAIALLAPHLTPQNRDVLLRRATHRSKREIEELLAEVAPRSDAPALIRKLPERQISRPLPASPPRGPCSPTPSQASSSRATPSQATLSPAPWSAGERATLERTEQSLTSAASRPSPEVVAAGNQTLRPDEVVSSGLPGLVARPPAIQPLSPARYKVQFTASAVLRDKLERLRNLMRSSVPDGDLAALIDAAVTEKLERLEARRFGRTRRPRKALSGTDTTPRSRHIPAAVKRTVDARDEGRCAYVDEQGRRCKARGGLQFHHRHTFATGGDHSLTNLALVCAGHNRYLAEIDYGREAVNARAHRSGGPSE